MLPCHFSAVVFVLLAVTQTSSIIRYNEGGSGENDGNEFVLHKPHMHQIGPRIQE